MTPESEAVVLCEGFYDRAFWAEWLTRGGCRDARPKRGNGKLGPVKDPFGKSLAPGDFAYLSASGGFVRVRPCHGDKNVIAQAMTQLKERTTQGLRRLVINIDTDALDDDGAELRAEGLRQAIEARVLAIAPSCQPLPDGDLALDDGATLVSVVLWAAPDEASEELPSKQTLERLVCAALRSAYPERAAAVRAWLAGRGELAPVAGPKEHAWSHMAGWYGGSNCDDFYHAVWRDAAVAVELEARLRRAGAWRVAEALSR